MCKLLIISAQTFVEGINAIGDIVGVFDDSHNFTETERSLFDVAVVPNLTRDELISALKMPTVQVVIDDFGTVHKMWRNSADNDWMKLNKEVKYLWSVIGVSDEEKAYLQSTEASTEEKIAVLQAFGNNLSRQAENRVTKINVTITETGVE